MLARDHARARASRSSGRWTDRPMAGTFRRARARPDASRRPHDEPHRSPIALALSADGTRLLVANQTAGTVSLVDTKSARVLHEIKTGDKPAGVALVARRPARRGHSLVRLRPGRARPEGRQDRRGRLGSRSVRSRGASRSRPTARRLSWPWASATRSSASI